MVPMMFSENLFDDLFNDAFGRSVWNTDKALYGKNASRIMKTDVHETEDSYELAVEIIRGRLRLSEGRFRQFSLSARGGRYFYNIIIVNFFVLFGSSVPLILTLSPASSIIVVCKVMLSQQLYVTPN